MDRFYYCERCGAIVGRLSGEDKRFECCGDGMRPLEPATDDAARDKHAPVLRIDGNEVTVSVGRDMHPMTEGHKILWVYLRTDRGGHFRKMRLGEEPSIRFSLVDEMPEEVFAYCSLHGLWKTEINPTIVH